MKNFTHIICVSHKPCQRSFRGRGRGFTLLEVLLALGIFAIGFSFIAAIFPVAALLQKRAFDDVKAQQVTRNTEALLRGRGINETDLENTGYGLPRTGTHSFDYDTDQKVHPMPRRMLSAIAPLSPTIWTLSDRSSPSLISDPTARKFYWVPLVVDTDPGFPSVYKWRIYVFVLQKRNNASYDLIPSYAPFTGTGVNADVWANPDDDSADGNSTTIDGLVPRVRSVKVSKDNSFANQLNFNTTDFNRDNDGNGLPDQIAVGDEILDNNGTIYTVFETGADYIRVDGRYGMINPIPNPVTEIWYAPPGHQPSAATPNADIPSGKPSPTVRILILPNGTDNPIIK